MYPGRALGHAFCAASLALPIAFLLAWRLDKLWGDTLLVVAKPKPEMMMIPLWVAAFVGLWCLSIYSDVRGWFIFESGGD
jgi:hypothetical protein